MEFWDDLYIELAEKITGLNIVGTVDNIQELSNVTNPKDRDCYIVKSENENIYRYNLKTSQFVNTNQTEAGGLKKIRWVDLWHEQINYLTTELPFPTPAVFLAFNAVDIADLSLLAQDVNTQVDFYLFFETLSDTYMGSYNQGSTLEFLKQLTELHKLFHGTDGENYSEMRRVDLKREDSGDAGNLYRISFQCMVYDNSASKQYEDTTINDISIQKGQRPIENISNAFDVDFS